MRREEGGRRRLGANPLRRERQFRGGMDGVPRIVCNGRGQKSHRAIRYAKTEPEVGVRKTHEGLYGQTRGGLAPIKTDSQPWGVSRRASLAFVLSPLSKSCFPGLPRTPTVQDLKVLIRKLTGIWLSGGSLRRNVVFGVPLALRNGAQRGNKRNKRGGG